MTLADLKIGEGGRITAVGGEGALRRRFLDMGLTPKTQVTVRKMAPLGDPIELYLRGYELTIRQEDARKIEVVRIPADACQYSGLLSCNCSECKRKGKE